MAESSASRVSEPGRNRLHGLSFQQLLLLAFLLIAGLLGASSLGALYSLEQLMVQSREGAVQATRLSAAAQALGQRGQTMERAARQSLVLGDAQLRRGFDDIAREAQQTLQQLQDGGRQPLSGQMRTRCTPVHCARSRAT